MANEPIESLTEPRPSIEPRGGALTCEFCESSLTQRGEVLRLSARAREIRKLSDRLDAEIAAHNETKANLTAAAQKVAELEQLLAKATGPAPAVVADSSPWGGR